MQVLNGVYTQWYNQRHQRVGHLFQGRFKAILVEKESYLLELTRYVVLNPVRAKMVRSVRDWPWSSYRSTVDQADCPEFLTVDWILSQFDSERENAIRHYRQYVRQGREMSVWEELRAGSLLGSKQYVERLRPLLREKRLDPEFCKRERFAARPSLELFSDVSDNATRNEQIHEAIRLYR